MSLDWNRLDEYVVGSGSAEDFRSNLSRQLGKVCDTLFSLPLCFVQFWLLMAVATLR